MRFDIVYMEVNEQIVTKSKIYNEIVNDFEKEISSKSKNYDM